MKNKRVKVSCDWPKHSKKVSDAIDTLITEGYVLHMTVSININGITKAIRVEKN